MTPEALAYTSQLGAAFLGFVFLLSSISKAVRPSVFIADVRGYNLLPGWAVSGAAWVIMILEFTLAATLLTGLKLTVGLSVSIALLAAFLIAVTTNLARGNLVPCGCFAKSREFISWRTAGRLVGLVAVALSSLGLLLVAGDPTSRFDLTGAADATAGLVVAIAVSMSVVKEFRWLIRRSTASMGRAGE